MTFKKGSYSSDWSRFYQQKREFGGKKYCSDPDYTYLKEYLKLFKRLQKQTGQWAQYF